VLIMRCPGAVVPPVVWACAADLNLLECGLLPNAGALLDQPHTWHESIGFLARERSEYRKEESRE